MALSKGSEGQWTGFDGGCLVLHDHSFLLKRKMRYEGAIMSMDSGTGEIFEDS